MAAASNNRVLRDHPVGQFILRAADAMSANQRDKMRVKRPKFENYEFGESRRTLLSHMITAIPSMATKDLRQYMLAVFTPELLGNAYVSRDGSSGAAIGTIMKTDDVVFHIFEFLPFDDAVNATLALKTPCYSQRLEKEECEPRIKLLTTIFETIAKNHYLYRRVYEGPHLPSMQILGVRTEEEDFDRSPNLESAVFLTDAAGDRLRQLAAEKLQAFSRKLQTLPTLKALECDGFTTAIFADVKVKKFTLNLKTGSSFQTEYLTGHEEIEHLVIIHGFFENFPYSDYALNLIRFEQLHTLELIDATVCGQMQNFQIGAQIRTLILKNCWLGGHQEFGSLKRWIPNLETVHFEVDNKWKLPPSASINELIDSNVKVTINHQTGEQYLLEQHVVPTSCSSLSSGTAAAISSASHSSSSTSSSSSMASGAAAPPQGEAAAPATSTLSAITSGLRAFWRG